MQTVTVRELKSNPSEALRDARDGPVLVLNRGVPEALIVTVAGEASRIGLADRVGEAVQIMQGLADRGGTRAVRAVDRASRSGAAEDRTPHATVGPDDRQLARLTAVITAMVVPRRISLAPRGEPTRKGRIIVELGRSVGRSVERRIEEAAERAGYDVDVRHGIGPIASPPGDEEVIFEPEDVPQSVLDRLIAEGRATPPRVRDGSLPPSTTPSTGPSATEVLLAERRGDAR